ncbi:MAG TPA: FecR domain-containing protein [Puia sp.]|nr:FecR domain-containing protein [Puia sp.]
MNELFKKYLSNSCSAEEMDELFQLIRQSKEDAPLRQLIQETYQSILNESEAYVAPSGELVISKAGEPEFPVVTQPIRHSAKKRIAAWATAAVLLAGAISTALYFHYSPAPAPIAAHQGMKKSSTERAEYKYLLLPDSTQVWLNAGSTLEYPEHFGTGDREVTLSGEAYFDVKNAAEKPFLIHTGHVLTTVLGTSFNINAYPGRTNITVSVSRGKVKVSRGNMLVATLVKGQEVNVADRDNIPSTQKNIEANNVAEWQQGNLVYDDQLLQDIIADLQRVYGANIRIDNANISQLRVSTRFRREQGLGPALEILCKLTDAQLYQKNGMYIIQ